MTKSERKTAFLMFLMGLGANLRVVFFGVMALSEIVAFFIAPILCWRYFSEMKRNGFLPLLTFPFLLIGGCFLACEMSNTPVVFFVKAAAIFYSIFAASCVYYVLLRKHFRGIGLFFFGFLISLIISAFAFNPQVHVGAQGTEVLEQVDLEEAMEGPLFWYPKINRVIQLPIIGMYLHVPIGVSIFILMVSIVVEMTLSTSGRGAAVMHMATIGLLVFGGRSREKIKRIGKYFVLFGILGLALAWSTKSMYKYFAKSGHLGRDAQIKYEMQTRNGEGALQLLMAGRSEFFVAMTAILDNPIFGFGPQAEDKMGYRENFIRKYGGAEDFDRYLFFLRQNPDKRRGIPQHSYLTMFWGYAGIIGLIFWIYIFSLIFKFFRRYAHAIPQWYGYFALSIPSFVWGIFFSPYNQRMVEPLLIVCILLARAVALGKLRLPFEMEVDARRMRK